MQPILLFISILFSVVCAAQGVAVGRGALTDGTQGTSSFAVGSSALTGSIQLGYGSSALVPQKPFVPKSILKYDTVKCIVIYLDKLEVKADSCLKIFKAILTKQVYTPPAPCNYNSNGMVGHCAVMHYGTTTEEPDYQLFKLIGYRKKEVPIQSIIQYK